jgi:hypothetical protein
LLALVVGIVGALVGSFAPTTAHAASSHKYPTLEAAVAAGALDPAVVDELRSSGRAHVLIRVHDSAGAAGGLAPTKAEVSSRADEVIRIHAHVPFVDAAVHSEDSLLDVLDDAATELVAAPHELQKSLQESLPLIRQPQALALGATGAGTAVAVLDTGVDYTRPEFGSCQAAGSPGCRVAFSVDVGNDDGFLDDDGHGTNVSAIVIGVAPSTSLYVYDVFQGSSGSTDDLVTALDDVLTRRQQGANIRSVNLSLGSGPDPSCSGPGGIGDPGFAQLRAAGVVPVVASGNDKNAIVIAWPACISSSIAVGATYDANVGGLSYQVGCTDGTTFVDKIACFSNSGPGLDMLAPGALITAGGSTLAGTSQATPHVAGAIAAVAQSQPGASTAAVLYAVTQSGPLITDPRNGIAVHRLDLEAAVNTVRSNFFGGFATADPDAVARSGNKLDVVARGSDSAAWFREAVGTSLGPWQSLGGVTTGSPAIVSMDGTRLDVFARGGDGALWTRTFTGTWSPWSSLGGYLSSDPDVASWGNGRLDVFARGGDNQLWHRAYGGGTWFPWEPIGGTLASGPSAVSWGNGRIDVVAVGSDSAVWVISWAGAWSGWSSIGGLANADPAVTSPASGRLDVFARAVDNKLWVKTFNGLWGPWRALGTSILGGPGAASNGRAYLEAVVRLPDGSVAVKPSYDGTSFL